MTLLATRVDTNLGAEFELMAKIQHKTKSQLLKEIIQRYLNEKKINAYINAAQSIAKHEKSNPDEYADLYALNRDWE